MKSIKGEKVIKLLFLCFILLSGYLIIVNQDKLKAFKEEREKEVEISNTVKKNLESSENLNENNEKPEKPEKSEKPEKQKDEIQTDNIFADKTIVNETLSDKTQAKEIQTTTLSVNSPALTILDTSIQVEQFMNDYFFQIEISPAIYDRIYGKSYKEDCPIPLDNLRYLKLLYYGFDHETYIGEMIVNKAIAEDVIQIFKELYEAKYPIEKMQLVDEYNGDDNASMTANNTSSFNFRYIDGTTNYSNHALGLAIDINPLYNPYVRTKNGKLEVLPEDGKQYADRNLLSEYYIEKSDFAYQTFLKYGFTWGGDWKNSKDYQHFEKNLK